MERLSCSSPSLATIVLLILSAGCASLDSASKDVKPEFRLDGIHVTGLSTKALDLAFDVEILNRMEIPIRMMAFDYGFDIQDLRLVEDAFDEGIDVPASEAGIVTVPVSLPYKNLYKAFKKLRKLDEFDYALECGFQFDTTFAGQQRLPLLYEGTLPVIRPPKIEVADIKVGNLAYPAANFEMELLVENPNSFSFDLGELTYALNIDGKEWIRAAVAAEKALEAKGSTSFLIPVEMDFSELGRTVFDVLSGNRPLDYHLTGNLDLSSSLPIFDKVSMPLDAAGSLNLLHEQKEKMPWSVPTFDPTGVMY